MVSKNFAFLAILFCSIKCQSSDPDFVRACYFTNWSQDRLGNGHFGAENYESYLCTHLFYAFAHMTPEYGISNSDVRDENGGYARILFLKNYQPDLKVLLSFGGFQYSQENEKLLQFMMANRKTREYFINSVIKLLKLYKFDGVDLAIFNSRRRKDFSFLIKELREALKILDSNLLLVVSISGSPAIIRRRYDLANLAGHVDMLNIMAYSFYGPWSTVTGHSSPLFDKNGEKMSIKAVADTVLDSGFPKNKIIFSLPTFMYGWKMASPNEAGVGTPISGLSSPGPYTNSSGMLANYELCLRYIRGQINVIYDNVQEASYITVNSTWWYSVEDKKSFRAKLKWIRKNQFAGVSVWSLDLDDFRGICTGQKYPLINLLTEISTTTSVAMATTTVANVNAAEVMRHQTLVTYRSSTPQSIDTNVSCSKIGYQKNSQNCQSFYYCTQINGEPKLYYCEGGLLYNSKREQCDIPSNVQCV